jgi:hypothetical protein
MPNSNRRPKLVNFRLSGEEHKTLKAAAFTYGSPNLSQYVRGIVLASVNSGLHPHVASELDGPGLEDNILQLQATIQHLSGLLDLIGSAFVREARRQIASPPGSRAKPQG